MSYLKDGLADGLRIESNQLITPPQNRGGAIFSVQFVCVCMCVRVSVRLSVSTLAGEPLDQF